MALMQLNLDGRDKIQEAIYFLKCNEPKEDYYLAFSGGTDSVATYQLAIEAGVPFIAYYHIAPTDPPELVQFIREEYPDVLRVKRHYNFWDLIVKKGLPTRVSRWCCEYIKEWGGENRLVITGIRAEESPQRRKRAIIHKGHRTKFSKGAKLILNPIIGWTKEEVWEYLRLRRVKYCSLYDEGSSGAYKGDGYWQRLGCVLCPMESRRKTLMELRRWPKLSEHWHRACQRLFEARPIEKQKWNTAEEMWQWWLARGEIKCPT